MTIQNTICEQTQQITFNQPGTHIIGDIPTILKNYANTWHQKHQQTFNDPTLKNTDTAYQQNFAFTTHIAGGDGIISAIENTGKIYDLWTDSGQIGIVNLNKLFQIKQFTDNINTNLHTHRQNLIKTNSIYCIDLPENQSITLTWIHREYANLLTFSTNNQIQLVVPLSQ